MKFGSFCPVVSEEKSFESVDGRRTMDDGRTKEASHPISSPGAFGSGELKNTKTRHPMTEKLTH